MNPIPSVEGVEGTVRRPVGRLLKWMASLPRSQKRPAEGAGDLQGTGGDRTDPAHPDEIPPTFPQASNRKQVAEGAELARPGKEEDSSMGVSRIPDKMEFGRNLLIARPYRPSGMDPNPWMTWSFRE